MAKEKETNVEQEQAPEQTANVSVTGTFNLGVFAAVASDAGATGLEALDSTDLKLPKIKLVQITSEEATKLDIKAGYFYNTVTKEAVDHIDCILLKLGKSRVMWPPQFKRGDKPLCRSFDGLKKTEGCGDGNCASCQYSQWPDNGEKPECTMGYVWLGLDEKNRPFRLSAQGTSVSPTKDFLNAVAPQLKQNGKHLGIFVFKMRLTSEKQNNEKGTYYTLKYTPVGLIDLADYTALENQCDSLSELFFKAIDRDTLVVDAEDYGDAATTDAPADGGEKKSGTLF